MSGVRTETWHLAPHDPLVLGVGRRLPATLPRMTHAVPLPATLAGAVRARFVEGADDVGRDRAEALVRDVALRGPWLQRGDDVLVRAPLHVRVHAPPGAVPPSPDPSAKLERPSSTGGGRAREEADAPRGWRHRRVVYPTLETYEDGEGVLWPDGTPPTMGVLTWELPEDVHKSEALDEFVTLDGACALLLEETRELGAPERPVVFEGRVHVTIDPVAQTAEPAALYSSSGVRYAEGVTLAVEVTVPDSYPRPSERMFVLGGETRVVARRDGPPRHGEKEREGFPGFDVVRGRYEKALREKGEPSGLRLMLVTPASFSTREGDAGAGWVPPWLAPGGRGTVDGLDDLRFELAAVATGRFVPVSGWSLAHRDSGSVQGMQRAVRRLVPAGTVYHLRLVGGARGTDTWLRACEHFWGRAIDAATSGSPEALLAPPHRDGYGMVIPGLWWPEGDGVKR